MTENTKPGGMCQYPASRGSSQHPRRVRMVLVKVLNEVTFCFTLTVVYLLCWDVSSLVTSEMIFYFSVITAVCVLS